MNVLYNEIKLHTILLKGYFLGFVLGFSMGYLIFLQRYTSSDMPFSELFLMSFIFCGPVVAILFFISLKNQHFNLDLPWDQLMNQIQSQNYGFIGQFDNHFIFKNTKNFFSPNIVLINNKSSFAIYGLRGVSNKFKKRFNWQVVNI